MGTTRTLVLHRVKSDSEIQVITTAQIQFTTTEKQTRAAHDLASMYHVLPEDGYVVVRDEAYRHVACIQPTLDMSDDSW